MSIAIGAPQIAALLILIQRGAEEIHSARNTRALLARGAREEGAGYYPVVAVAHLSWIASLFFLIPPDAQHLLAVDRPLCRLAGGSLLGDCDARSVLDASHHHARRGPDRFVRCLSLHEAPQLRHHRCRDPAAARLRSHPSLSASS